VNQTLALNDIVVSPRLDVAGAAKEPLLVVRELVERAARGDADAFDALAAATAGRLDAAARLILRDPDVARDAVQETYAQAWRSLRGLRDPDRFEAWIHRLLARACYDELRRRRRRPIEVELTDLHPLPGADLQSRTAERDELDRALRRLDPDLRTVIVLFYYLDLSVPEIAAALGIPPGTTKSRLFRAREALRVGLTDEGAIRAGELEGRPA
jgi:RNA polymerase sigma-70 factor (ECF subfamily)